AQQGETNEAGKLELQLPTSASEAQEFYRPRDYDYQFSFDVASANGQTATQTIHVPVYQGDVTMQVSGESFIVGEKDSLVYD
ncbi:hypothetical protein, partial [Streptomyces scabiei]|uniref:hypothetical protein n=1 Tax=Streptomyces scabiei TaxID=1930 RepID=UPI0038F7A8DF